MDEAEVVAFVEEEVSEVYDGMGHKAPAAWRRAAWNWVCNCWVCNCFIAAPCEDEHLTSKKN